MMAIKVILRVQVFALLVFSMLAKHQARGEKDCYDQQNSVKYRCKKNLKFVGPYISPVPGDECCRTVAISDMVCICGILSEEEITQISSASLILIAKDCGHPLPVGTKCGSKCLILLLFSMKNPCIIGHVLLNFPFFCQFGLFDRRSYRQRVVHKSFPKQILQGSAIE
ncbi:hypothetical protein HU200_062976 [Digitaria exilis]|uniref:Bifunctional inhibitor/plant lipid transfer protein/seed storage helical domain-containing protein n=1 Tax=Digitaria exilis TaxID=1010633 RepID=A0A835A6H7_9POAL|nr:hypothetical protein HU200_062976 [Digitaria exilis]